MRLGDRAASFGAGPKMLSKSHVCMMPQAAYVNRGLWHGVVLTDPAGLLEGTGAWLRHVKGRMVAAARSPAVRARRGGAGGAAGLGWARVDTAIWPGSNEEDEGAAADREGR